MSVSLMHELATRDYECGEPQEGGSYGEWQAFELACADLTGMPSEYRVRVVVYYDDGPRWEIFVMWRKGEVWSVKPSPATPLDVIMALIDAAERDAAER